MHLRLYRRSVAFALVLGALVASLVAPVTASAYSCYSTSIGSSYAYASCSDGSSGYAQRIGSYTYYTYTSPYGGTSYASSNTIGNYTYYTYSSPSYTPYTVNRYGYP